MESTTKITVQVLTAFTDEGLGGNPAGVVLDADLLTHSQKLEIASKVGLSETAFVSTSRVAAFKLDFYTPNKQIPHCGHATIATFSYLRQLGVVGAGMTSKETIDGIRAIEVRGDMAYMEQSPPKFRDVSHRTDAILRSMGLRSSDLLQNAPLQVVHTGNSFLLIPVKNSGILKTIIPKHDQINDLSEEYDLIGFYPFTTDTHVSGRDASSRMFGPRYDIYEEAGTGMAAGPLACYLHQVLNVKKNKFLIEQGHYMEVPSPSLIVVDLTTDGKVITGLMTGGRGMRQRQLEIEVPV